MKSFFNRHKVSLFYCAGFFLFFLSIHNPALASSSGGGGLPYESWLETITASITGPVAFAMMLFGLVAAGSMLIWGGEIATFLKTLIYIVLVAAFIIGATRIMSSLFGHGAMLG